MKDLNSFKLKITTLSPLHIGTGEVYEPTNFVIDNGYLYEFDESLFLQALPIIDRNKFNQVLDNYLQVIDFYKNHKELAKKIAYHKTKVTKKVTDRYNTIRNKDNSKNKNLFEIQKTYKSPNTHKGIILGSSLKGMLDTVFQIYPQKIRENEVRQNLIVSDFLMLHGDGQVGYCYRRHKNPQREAKSSIPQIIEIINKDSSFVGAIKTQYSFKEIQKKTQEYLSANSRENNFFQTSQNSFIARIGKFSGKAFMVDNGENVLNNDRKPVATHTLYEDDSQFGWIKVELIDEQEYQNAILSIDKQNQQYYDDLRSRQYEIKKVISEQKEKKIQEAREREEKRKAELIAQEKRQKEEQERLASLSPFELKIEELKKEYPDKNASESIIVYQAIIDNKIEEFKQEALEFVKAKMIEEKIWDKPKKKSACKRTQKIIEMMGQND